MSWAIKIEYKRLFDSPLETENIGSFESMDDAEEAMSSVVENWTRQHGPVFWVAGSAVYVDDGEEEEYDEDEDEVTETFVVKVTVSGGASADDVMKFLNDKAYDSGGVTGFDYAPISIADLSEFGFVKGERK